MYFSSLSFCRLCLLKKGTQLRRSVKMIQVNLFLKTAISCREMFQFDLPSAILKKRAEKFDSALLN